MATKRIAFNEDTKIVTVLETTGTVPEGSEVIGTFTHEDQLDPLGPVKNHVLFHHVRDLLYPLGEWNFQTIKIQYGENVDPLPIGETDATGVSLTPRTGTVEVGATLQLTATLEPENASNQNVTFESSDEAIATVSETGLVTGVAAGEVQVGVQTEDGGFTDVSTITVTTAE